MTATTTPAPAEILTLRQVQAKKFKPMTVGYKLPDEQRWMDNALRDCARNNCPACLVETVEGYEIWRSPVGWKKVDAEEIAG
jgi:hypothetical protein